MAPIALVTSCPMGMTTWSSCDVAPTNMPGPNAPMKKLSTGTGSNGSGGGTVGS